MNYIQEERGSTYGKLEQQMTVENPMSSLMLIDFMVTELCNRTCEFCPRADSSVYPNLNLNMSLELIEKIASELQQFDYQGRLLFCGFGESLLYKDLEEAIRLLKRYLPNNKNVHLVTNCDRLNADRITSLVDAGLDTFYLSLYDGVEQEEHFVKLFASLGLNNYFLQRYYLPKEENYGFVKLSNRGGMLFNDKYDGTCNIPFYAMSVNWDGRVLLCSHDWFKSTILGDLTKSTIQEVWLNSPVVKAYRDMLAKGERTCGPCNRCNVFGNLYGEKSKEILCLRSSVDESS